MDVTVVQQYLESRKNQQRLESQFKKLEKQLQEERVRVTELLSKIDLNSLISAKSVKVINGLISNQPLWLNDFPVSFASLTFKSGNTHLSVVFAQPLFRGWRTEMPYRSYQSCPLSLETPSPPDENHIPQYISVLDYDMDVVCWECEGNVLKLWLDEQRVLVLRWGSK